MKSKWQVDFTTIAIVLIAGIHTNPAQATLIGDTVSCEGRISFLTCAVPGTVIPAPDALVTDPGVEFYLNNRFDVAIFSMDLSDSRIVISNLVDGLIQDANGFQWIVSDLDWVGASGSIVGLDVTYSGNFDPFDVSTFSFTDDSVTYTAQGTRWLAGASITIDLLVDHGDTHPVSAPGTLGLLGLGVLLTGVARRARRISRNWLVAS